MTAHSSTPRRPALLVILDGFGINPEPTHNAIVQAKTPNFDRYFADYPMTTLEASGRGVGLPAGQMGNSEVGHMTIGSGSIVKLNSGIEFAAIYFVMILALLMIGGGRFFSVDFYIGLLMRRE